MRNIETMLQDIRYALRQLRKNPGFTSVALITLALCLGANLTIFAVVDSILVRPLPFPGSDRLVILYNAYPKAGKDRDGASLTNYYERRGNIPAFAQIASMNYVTSVVGESGSTESVDIGRVTPEFFSTLGVVPLMGRAFNESEMTYQTDNEAILTNEYWRQHFNSDPNVLGRDVRCGNQARKIVGVLPAGFRFLSSHAQIFMPLSSEEGERNAGARHNNNDMEIARLRPGATLAEAQSQIDARNNALAAGAPYAKEVAEAGFRTIVAPLHADHVASIRPTLLLLQAGALFLLLIGGVNIVNLLLIRASGRAKELAVRQSMGASRKHVVGQVMTETVLLALIGGIFGLVVGAAGIRLLAALGADQLPLGATIAFDGPSAMITLLGSIVMGILIALPISWYNLRGHLAVALQSESRGGTITRASQRVRQGFIVIQIGSAFVLLAGAGLLGLSLKRAMAVSPGFRTDHVLTGQLSIPWASYHDGPSFLRLFEPVLEAAQRQPGVSGAGLITYVPLSGAPDSVALDVIGYAPKPGASLVLHPIFGVVGDYFSAMGVVLREGRFLTADETRGSEWVCVVDENFARYYWPHGSAVGQQISYIPRKADGSNVFTIVGVVGAVKQDDLTEGTANGAIYVPYVFPFSRSYFLAVRTSLPPEVLEVPLRKIVRQVDPDMPISNLQSMQTRIDDSLMTRRSPALLTGIFSAVALLLAAIGTYGVLSYAVAQRRREIGVRMALGALPKQVLTHFMTTGAKLLLVGVALGVVGAWASGRAMQSVLFGVGVLDVGVLVASGGVMMLVVLLACFIPARRAAKVDPVLALRYE
jgi:predicted permease